MPAFTPLIGAGANVTNIGAVMMLIEGQNVDNITLSNIGTANLIAGTLTDNTSSPVNPGDTLQYTAVLTNPADPSNAPEDGVLFTLTPRCKRNVSDRHR